MNGQSTSLSYQHKGPSGTSAEAASNRIDSYLQETLIQGGSDLHFIAGEPPRIRLHGELCSLSPELLEPAFVEEALREMTPAFALLELEAKNGTDFAYVIQGVSRFRVNILRHLNGLGAIFRAIPPSAKTMDELKIPDAVRNLCKLTSGLVLVTGKTGSGKSTTLAAMIDDINRRRKGHIITIEDPIEFVHSRKNCLISQREIGLHTPTFSDALHSALREDPDVILVGEMRDYDTISTAVTAAEMGILVMGTLHTNGATATIDRIINAFPADKQLQVRSMLSTSLRGVISQQLIPTKARPGRVAAMEIMINTPAVANLIRQGKLDQLENTLQSGAATGMCTMDNAIQELLDKNIISGRNAYLKAIHKPKFEACKEQN